MAWVEIEHWGEVPEGAHVSEDAHPELYVLNWKGGKPYITQIGWLMLSGAGGKFFDKTPRLVDWDPQPYMDQGWFMRTPSKDTE